MGVDHDRLFKELLTTFFAEFMELFFPRAHALIDYIDILVEVGLKGESGYVLIHVEPQSYRQAHFDRRMFKYFCRLYERHIKKFCPSPCFPTTAGRWSQTATR